MKAKIIILLSVFFVAFYSCHSQDKQLVKAVDAVLSSAYPEVKATVKDGIVTLTGMVESLQAKTAVEQSLKSLKNIKSIHNLVDVVPPNILLSRENDDVMKDAISTTLANKGFKHVKVEVTNGEVFLSGHIDRGDLEAIMQTVNEARPEKVVNNLTLK